MPVSVTTPSKFATTLPHLRLPRRIAEAGDDDVARFHILFFGVVVGGDDRLDARGLRGRHAVFGILHHKALFGFQPQFGKSQVVDFGIGLLLADHVARQHQVEFDIRKDLFGNCFGGLLVCRSAYPDLQSGFHRLFHEPVDARSQGKFARLDQFHEQRGLALMHILDEIVNLSSLIGLKNPLVFQCCFMRSLPPPTWSSSW